MQEPSLFNYSLLENILYGKLKANNEEIYNAAKIANALEFIESEEMSRAFSDEPASLKQAMLSVQLKDKLIDEIKVSIIAERNDKLKKEEIVLNEAGDQCESKKDKTGKVTQTVLKKLDIEAQARYDRYLEILTKLTAKAEA